MKKKKENKIYNISAFISKDKIKVGDIVVMDKDGYLRRAKWDDKLNFFSNSVVFELKKKKQ